MARVCSLIQGAYYFGMAVLLGHAASAILWVGHSCYNLSEALADSAERALGVFHGRV